MNKAFVREPDMEGRAYCPRCGTLGLAVGSGPLDTYVQPAARGKMHDGAWFCNFSRCEVVYFNSLESVVVVGELVRSVFPKDLDAPICACFGLDYDDVLADSRQDVPVRIRELLARTKTPQAQCAALAADGRCCIQAVQELYVKLRSQR